MGAILTRRILTARLHVVLRLGNLPACQALSNRATGVQLKTRDGKSLLKHGRIAQTRTRHNNISRYTAIKAYRRAIWEQDLHQKATEALETVRNIIDSSAVHLDDLKYKGSV
jgi:hypothetical protein